MGAICAAPKPVFQRNGLESREVVYDPETGAKDGRWGFWIHVDGALGATYMPFLEMAHEQGRISAHGPVFDFRLPYVHSIAASGHKPNAAIVAKYSLSCESVIVDGAPRHYAHVYLMESVTRARIDALMEDLSQPDAFPAASPP